MLKDIVRLRPVATHIEYSTSVGPILIRLKDNVIVACPGVLIFFEGKQVYARKGWLWSKASDKKLYPYDHYRKIRINE